MLFKANVALNLLILQIAKNNNYTQVIFLDPLLKLIPSCPAKCRHNNAFCIVDEKTIKATWFFGALDKIIRDTQFVSLLKYLKNKKCFFYIFLFSPYHSYGRFQSTFSRMYRMSLVEIYNKHYCTKPW